MLSRRLFAAGAGAAAGAPAILAAAPAQSPPDNDGDGHGRQCEGGDRHHIFQGLNLETEARFGEKVVQAKGGDDRQADSGRDIPRHRHQNDDNYVKQGACSRVTEIGRN